MQIDSFKQDVLVVSKDYFNQNEQIIACPIVCNHSEGPLHIRIQSHETSGVVLCEQMKYLDLKMRHYIVKKSIPLNNIIDITDAIQSIFDYYPYE